MSEENKQPAITDAAREAVYETHYNESGGPHWVTLRKSDGQYFAYHYIREAADQLTEMLNGHQRAIDAATAELRRERDCAFASEAAMSKVFNERCATLAAKDREIVELKELIAKQNRALETLHPYGFEECAEKDREIAELRTKKTELVAMVESASAERDQLRAEVKELRLGDAGMRRQILNQSNEIAALRAEVERLCKADKVPGKLFDDVVAARDRLVHENATLKGDVLNLRAELMSANAASKQVGAMYQATFDRAEKAEAEVERLTLEKAQRDSVIKDLKNNLRDLDAQLAAAQEDASRYRYIRANPWRAIDLINRVVDVNTTALWSRQLNDAIDAARRAIGITRPKEDGK